MKENVVCELSSDFLVVGSGEGCWLAVVDGEVLGFLAGSQHQMGFELVGKRVFAPRPSEFGDLGYALLVLELCNHESRSAKADIQVVVEGEFAAAVLLDAETLKIVERLV